MTNDIIKSVTVVTPQKDWSTKSCGCKWNLDDKFIEQYCDKHLAEMQAESEQWQAYEEFYGD